MCDKHIVNVLHKISTVLPVPLLSLAFRTANRLINNKNKGFVVSTYTLTPYRVW